MKVQINANHCDVSTVKIADELRPVVAEIGEQTSGNYGGIIEHLWIDLELSEMEIKAFGKPPKPFRFQKRVSGHSRMELPPIPDSYNVGHYSVRPNFESLDQKTVEENVAYLINVIYQSTELLLSQQKKLGGFNALAFRNRFFSVATALGFNLGDEKL